MKKLCGIFFIACFLFSGCATKRIIDESGNIEMYVMVYDYENKGLQGTHIFIDDKETGTTDIYGRYVLALKEGKTYHIRIEKNEYEAAEQSFVFEPMYVLYFQIGNAAQLLRLAENAMDKGGYEEALGFLDRSIKLDEVRIDAVYLKAVAYYKTGLYEDALDVLETLLPLIKNKNLIEDLQKQMSLLSGISGGNV